MFVCSQPLSDLTQSTSLILKPTRRFSLIFPFFKKNHLKFLESINQTNNNKLMIETRRLSKPFQLHQRALSNERNQSNSQLQTH